MADDFERLVHDEQQSLLRLAWALTGNDDRARDLVQEALVRGFTKRRHVLRADHPAAYLRTILVNLWRSWRPGREYPTDTLPERGQTDEHHLERAELLRALATLSPQQRLIISLRYFDDCSIRTTAALAGCSEQTVTTQTSRAMAALRVHPALVSLKET